MKQEIIVYFVKGIERIPVKALFYTVIREMSRVNIDSLLQNYYIHLLSFERNLLRLYERFL